MNGPGTGQYRPRIVESEAQEFWERHRCFNVKPDPAREKFYCLSMFPYPSGRLHMGHVRNYTIGDSISRYHRMLGKQVLQPMGWDAFGLPAENAAINSGVSPAQWTQDNIAMMRTQLKRLGFAYDWDREMQTCDPDYYRWEQWFFNRLYEKGMAYRKAAWVNWDPVDRTVLANEQVIDGKGWRSGASVERKCVQQWFLRITDYAEELVQGLDRLDGWPEQVRAMQRNWIGRSQGLEIDFAVAGRDEILHIFTTRPDTLMGVSFVALAPEHPLIGKLVQGFPALQYFVEQCAHGSVAAVALAAVEKEGLDTGLTCVHPLTEEAIPVWCANFVLMEYGSGAVMGVPAHDARDWEFARKKHLPIRQVIRPADPEKKIDLSAGAFVEKGIVCHPGKYDGMDFAAAYAAIANDLEKKMCGRQITNYRLRDWGISRQRYWGCPIPMRWLDGVPHPVEDKSLPVVLPPIDCGGGKIPTLGSIAEFVHARNASAECRSDTDTFDTFVESSWYYARFAGGNNADKMLGDEAQYWLPVDQYVGGIEHAVLHLLYARFFYRLMRDMGLLEGDEPFTRLLTQGMVLKDGVKMSKSRGNTVDPETLVEQYGADTVRLFILFAAPPEHTLEWSDAGVVGASRFLKRLWKLVTAHILVDEQLLSIAMPDAVARACSGMRRIIHATIVKVTDDIHQRYQFNTAIAANMKLFNELSRFEAAYGKHKPAWRLAREGLEAILKMLSPMVPHITHCLWQRLGHTEALVDCAWPVIDAAALKTNTCTVVVQVNGKLRSRLSLPVGSKRETVEKISRCDDQVQKFLYGHSVRKVIWVPDRLINFVTEASE